MEFTYKNGRFFKDNCPYFMTGVEYQYYRDIPANWRPRLQQLYDSNANVLTFYIPWRHHLLTQEGPQKFDFIGSSLPARNLVHFMEIASEVGFHMIAKPGPFVHSELNIGGLPDRVSPSYNPEISAVMKSNGEPLTWEYDGKILPSPFDPAFDELTQQWLEEVGVVLNSLKLKGAGKLIGIQLNDETVYCTANDPPWSFGYDRSSLDYYYSGLKSEYNSIEELNSKASTLFKSFEELGPPDLPTMESPISSKEDCQRLIEWGKFQWRLRRDLYQRYKEYLKVDLPYLSNFAGITPPIEENIPGQDKKDKSKDSPLERARQRLYSDWWFSKNRVDSDAGVYHYGMISWLGVAAYDEKVFSRYVNTSRRARGINMEENWGFSKLYHEYSKYPIIPFYQTLLSVAAGCTGYVVFCGVQHEYWDSDLDSVTKLQQKTFPADAPICSNGMITPMYQSMKAINTWFTRNSELFLRAEPVTDITWLIDSDAASVSSWVPCEEVWSLDSEIPRAGVDAFEPFSYFMQEKNYSLDLIELAEAPLEKLQKINVAAIRLHAFMDEKSQIKLYQYTKNGGTLISSGEMPSLLAEKLQPGLNQVGLGRFYCSKENIFTETHQDKLKVVLKDLEVTPFLQQPEKIRSFLYQYEDHEFLFFFNQDDHGNQLSKDISWANESVKLNIASKACGVIHLHGHRIMSAIVKGLNEVLTIESETSITYKADVISGRGDWMYFG